MYATPKSVVKRGILAVGLLWGCTSIPADQDPGSSDPPDLVVGEFEGDYGIRYTITRDTWIQHPQTTYLMIRWNLEGRYMIARNDADNSADGGLWTRIDWVELTDMAPYDWAFCISAYQAPSDTAAEQVTIADPQSLRTGCNGHPYSRMQRMNEGVGLLNGSRPSGVGESD